MVKESNTVKPNFLLLQTDNQKSSNYLAIKLNRLKEKQVRFESQKEFLSGCITDGLVPKGLDLMPELPIRNHYQYFLDNWHSKLKQFLLSLMKDIVQFCDKLIDATTTETSTTETSRQTKNNLKQFKVKLKATKQLLERYCNNENSKSSIL